MAKVVGLIGSASGKVGNVVYAVTNGIQTARVYQPVVANPKTKGQTDQRAKMSLAGRLSAILPSMAIDGMPGANLREKRGAFIKSVIRVSTINADMAKVEPSGLVLSVGRVQVYQRAVTVTATAGAADGRVVTVAVSQTAAAGDISSRPANYRERLVVLAVNGVTSNYDYARVVDANLPTTGGTAAVTNVQFYLSEGASDYTFYVYAVPFNINTDVYPSGYSYLGGGSDINVEVSSTSYVAAAAYGDSVFEGSAVVGG